MRDFEFKLVNANETVIYGTENDVISIPEKVKFDSYGNSLELYVKELNEAEIGILSKVGDLEVRSINKSNENKELYIQDIAFEQLELDLKGDHTIYLDYIEGNIDVNITKGKVLLVLPEEFDFSVAVFGQSTKLENDISNKDGKHTLEIYGKNSTVKLARKAT